MTNQYLNREAIKSAHGRIRPFIRRTPLLQLDPAEFCCDAAGLAFKLEYLQHAGSFKTRGAFAHLLSAEIPAAGVTAASGGNHGAAVAYAARHCGMAATIFVPEIASPAKLDRIRAFGAELVISGANYAESATACEAHAKASGARMIHAYDQPETIIGQGTMALEIEADAPETTTIIVAVGGGGLIAGACAWFGHRLKIVAVEPEHAPTLRRALDARQPVDVEVSGIAADSLGARRIGRLAFELASAHVDESILVSDEAIREAQVKLWTECRIVAEPGGAAALAALLSGAYQPEAHERVCVVLCGANTSALPQ